MITNTLLIKLKERNNENIEKTKSMLLSMEGKIEVLRGIQVQVDLRGGEIATNRLKDQEVAVLSLHPLQNYLVYINTLMIQTVLSEGKWLNMMTPEDLRALSPLIYSHVNPYGTFKLDMMERIQIEERSYLEEAVHF